MQDWVRSVMQLRDRTPVLQKGKLQTLLADKDSLAFVRAMDTTRGCGVGTAEERYLVVVNNGDAAEDVAVPNAANAVTGCSRYTAVIEDGAAAQVVDGSLQVHLPKQTIGVFRAEQ